MLDEGVWAEVKAGDEHLRLFSERNAQGVQASVYSVQTKQWIAPSEGVEDIEGGKAWPRPHVAQADKSLATRFALQGSAPAFFPQAPQLST